MNKKKLIVLSAGFAILQGVHAKPAVIQVGAVKYQGSGCPEKSVKVGFNHRRAEILLGFRQYSLELKGRNRQGKQDKSCSVVIPLKVPEGKSISLESANYEGRIDLDEAVEVKLVNDYSFDGKRGRRFKTVFRGPSNYEYHLTDALSRFAGVWSACGQQTELRLSVSMRIEQSEAKGRNKANAKTRVSSAHMRRGLTTRLKIRECAKAG